MPELFGNHITYSANETENLGKSLAEHMKNDPASPNFIALYGDLGVGKTAFVRGFVSDFSEKAAVRSPTFSLVNEYKTPAFSIYHFDMYRIGCDDDLYSIGFYDYLDGKGICIAEWCENIPFALPEKYIEVKIEKNDPENTDSRSISISKKQS